MSKRSYLKPGESHSMNVEGGQMTTDVRTSVNEDVIRRHLEAIELLSVLTHIEQIPDGVKLVWNIHTTTGLRDYDAKVRAAAVQISQLKE